MGWSRCWRAIAPCSQGGFGSLATGPRAASARRLVATSRKYQSPVLIRTSSTRNCSAPRISSRGAASCAIAAKAAGFTSDGDSIGTPLSLALCRRTGSERARVSCFASSSPRGRPSSRAAGARPAVSVRSYSTLSPRSIVLHGLQGASGRTRRQNADGQAGKQVVRGSTAHRAVNLVGWGCRTAFGAFFGRGPRRRSGCPRRA